MKEVEEKKFQAQTIIFTFNCSCMMMMIKIENEKFLAALSPAVFMKKKKKRGIIEKSSVK
jgi:hypothetical protein